MGKDKENSYLRLYARTSLINSNHMKKGNRFISALLAAFTAIGCSSASKMAEMYENVKVGCDPEVLEVIAGEIDAVVTVSYPAGYFHPKALLEVVPVLVYDGGEEEMRPVVYQGEKVKDNFKSVSSDGQTVRERIHFDYVKGMEHARLEFRAAVTCGSKTYAVPTRKIADGCNTTYMLVESRPHVDCKADGYQEIIRQTAEGQILYGINSSTVADSQLRSQSVKDFQEALDEIKANGRKTLTGTEVVAYASPDGGETLNAKLSDKRSESADKAFSRITKDKDVSQTSVRSVGQDWEGFQELVSRSDIEDKDLILRVLSMYSDPAVRESEIKNISEIYTSLKKSVLPELRRARFIANVEYQNYSAEELVRLVDDNIDVLDEEALLRAATLVDESDKKISLYDRAVEKFDSDRARFNLGVTLLNDGRIDRAESAFKAVKARDEDLLNAQGAVAMAKGDYKTASSLFRKSGNANAKANQAAIDILSGNYEAAAKALDGETGFNASLAHLLVDDINKAKNALTCKCPRSNYLRAVIAAREGDASGVQKHLEEARKMKAFADRAEKDVEFAQYR